MAGEAKDPQAAAFEEARRLYYAGIDGDASAASRSARVFQEMAQSQPSSPLVQAYFGSTRLIESSRTFAVWKKGRLAKEGLAALDGAVGAAPEDLEVRFVRAMSTYHLPAMFKREGQSRQDFSIVAREAEAAVDQGRLERRLAAAALLHHGLFLAKDNDRAGARKAWEAASRTGPETNAGREAARRLK